MDETKATPRPILYTPLLSIFFISGFLGLAYQVLWSKFLLNFIGVSAYSYAVVLATFMGGLAFGSHRLGKASDKVKSPLKFYAYLELGIGIYALVYIPLSRWAAQLYGSWVNFTPDQAGEGFGLWAKIILSILLLLPPTFLMGGTYPAFLRHVTSSPEMVGKRASQLYAVNSAGAVLGALFMSFVLVPKLGLTASLMFLALCNGLIGLFALLLSGVAISPSSDSEIGSTARSALTLRQTQLALLFIFAEGIMAFALETAWTRYFGIVLGSSTYSFSIMLAAFISGIALGSNWLSKLENQIQNPLRFFGWTQLAVGILVLLPLPFYPYVPWLFGQFASLLSQRPAAFYLHEFGKLLFCYLIMLPPGIFIGMSLPLILKGLSPGLKQLGREAGRIYAWDTWGNVTGALVAGLLLLPLLGMEQLLRWSAVGSILLGSAALFAFKPIASANRKNVLLPAGTAFVLVIVFFHAATGTWEKNWFTIVPFRRSATVVPFYEQSLRVRQDKILFFRDDPAAHVIVKKAGNSADAIASLYVNGKIDASSGEDMVSQIVMAHIPLLLHPDPKDVLVIGLASGITAGSAVKYPVQRVHVVEIVRAMFDASLLFGRWNGNPQQDKRFKMIIDDARNYVSHTRQRYDVIISEPSNPWTSETGSLFTTEFYQQTVRALKPDGLYLQWLQAYEVSDGTLGAIVRSFRRAFPYVYVFQGGSVDLLLLGSRKPLEPDWVRVNQRFQIPEVRQDLKNASVPDLPSLLYLQLLSPASVNYIAALDDLENTDDNDYLEYRAPRDLFEGAQPTLPGKLDERLFSSPTLFYADYLHRNQLVPSLSTLQMLSDRRIQTPPVLEAYRRAVSPTESDLELAARVTVLVNRNRVDEAMNLLQSAAPFIYLQSAFDPGKASFWQRQTLAWSRLLSNSREQLKLHLFYVQLLMASGKMDQATKTLVSLIQSETPPASWWAVLRAFQIDPEQLGPKVRKFYLQKRTEPFLQRLKAPEFKLQRGHYMMLDEFAAP